MSIENILCLLSGSLLTTMFFFLVSLRQMRIDERLINHVRLNAYNKGWADSKNQTWKEDV